MFEPHAIKHAERIASSFAEGLILKMSLWDRHSCPTVTDLAETICSPYGNGINPRMLHYPEKKLKVPKKLPDNPTDE